MFKKDKSLFVGPNAVKEAFDKFPTGICFFNSKGLLIISNNTMNAILYDQIHKELQYESELLNVLATCCDNTLISESGTLWQFQRKKIKKNWTEYVAFDITAIYKKNMELQKNNEELKNMLDNIRTTNRNIVEIAREQEILSMKMLIHNDMGRNILSLQRYYANGCNPSEKEDIIRQINKTISVLNWEDDEEDEVDDIKELTEIADSIGVKLEITGKMPKNKDSIMLVADSLRECITNFVKHAGSEASNAGKYTITSLSANGTELNLQDLAKAAGSSLDEFYIELKEDGTGSINANGEAQNLTWDKKNITVDGEAVPYTVKGNELSIVQEGITIKAEKE